MTGALAMRLVDNAYSAHGQPIAYAFCKTPKSLFESSVTT